MQNAHLRMGRLEYRRNSGSTNTRISVHVDRYVGEGDDAHLISLFGGDAEVGAITAAIHEKHTFTVIFPDGRGKVVGFGPDAICYRGSVNLQGRKQALRHLIICVRRKKTISISAILKTSSRHSSTPARQ